MKVSANQARTASEGQLSASGIKNKSELDENKAKMPQKSSKTAKAAKDSANEVETKVSKPDSGNSATKSSKTAETNKELKTALQGRDANRDADHLMDGGKITKAQVTARLAQALAERFDWDRVCDKIDELWDAERPLAYNGIITQWVPDTKLQAIILTLALAYREGRPVERTEVITREITTFDQILEKAAENPAYLDSLKGLIVKIESKLKTIDTDGTDQEG